MKNFTLALIAHDAKKEDMVQLVKAHKEALTEADLIATRSTGQLVMARTKLPVTLMQSGPLGGDQQIGAMVANDDIGAVIFLCDPLTTHPHEPDVSALLRVCDVHGVPLATNIATAEAILHLMAKHPEALHGHNLAAEYLDEIAAIHN
ncbi:MAG: methylglyoxal synthase [Dehalococcoidales bacterium]